MSIGRDCPPGAAPASPSAGGGFAGGRRAGALTIRSARRSKLLHVAGDDTRDSEKGAEARAAAVAASPLGGARGKAGFAKAARAALGGSAFRRAVTRISPKTQQAAGRAARSSKVRRGTKRQVRKNDDDGSLDSGNDVRRGWGAGRGSRGGL